MIRLRLGFPCAFRHLAGALALSLGLPLSLAGCGGLTEGGRDPVPRTAAADPLPAPGLPNPGLSASGSALGTGPVKVALILPLSAPGQAAIAAASLKNAAELAVSEIPDAGISLLVKDDRGTAEGAREAAVGAVAEGVDLILGPLFAPSVSAAGPVARDAARPVVAFSTDATVAARGVYLLSFLPAREVDRVVGYAAAQGRTSFAALIPNTTYGSVVEAAFREAAARRGLRVAAIERYASGQAGPAVTRLAPVFAGLAPQVDAMLIPAGGDDMPAIGTALQAAGLNTARVKLVGTGAWSDSRALRVPILQGGWFAAPDPAGFRMFSARYRARFGAEPVRLATLAYDATSLAIALARSSGSQRFSEAALQTPTGFSGADGIFRFRPDGTNERALTVEEVRGDAPVVISPAPKAFGASGL